MAKLAALLMLGVLSLTSTATVAQTHDREATLSYIASVFRDAELLRRSGGITLGHMAMIFENAANRIEDRDGTDVADDVVDWAFDTAKRFRNVALMFRDVGMRASVSGDYNVSGFEYGYFGYYQAWWRQTYSNNYGRTVASVDAGRFKWTQYYEVRNAGAVLRRKYR